MTSYNVGVGALLLVPAAVAEETREGKGMNSVDFRFETRVVTNQNQSETKRHDILSSSDRSEDTMFMYVRSRTVVGVLFHPKKKGVVKKKETRGQVGDLPCLLVLLNYY